MDTMLSNPPEWFVFVALGIAVVSILLGLITAITAATAKRRAADSASELAALRREVAELQASLAQRIDEAQLSLNQKIDEAAQAAGKAKDDAEAVRSRADAMNEMAEQARSEVRTVVDRLTKFEEYFRNVFETQLSSTFSSFDRTVSDVLSHMQSELERGISRINQMQSMVQSRTSAEEKLVESKEEVQNLLKEGGSDETSEEHAEPDDAPDEDESDAPDDEAPDIPEVSDILQDLAQDSP